MSKSVQVIGHAFDCLPGHITIAGRGSGSSLRVAVREAISKMLADPRLRRKHVNDFKMSVVVIADRKEIADATKRENDRGVSDSRGV